MRSCQRSYSPCCGTIVTLFMVTAMTSVMPDSRAAEPNYDEAAVRQYTLPDVLAGPDGVTVT